MKIIVGTENEAKVAGALGAFRAIFGADVSAAGRPVPSGVARQPKSDGESRAGAMNRSLILCNNCPGFDYYVGIESGLKPSSDHTGLFVMRDWVCVRNAAGQFSYGSGGGAYLPRAVCDLIRAGVSLSRAMRQAFPDYADVGGALAYLTNGATNRELEIRQAVLHAIVPFAHKMHYADYLGR
ncbi:MAG: DUF84 family protein [Rickettsiales bacterium]|jgi:inosine/xanthosine triphosphatase|nr:DUF84 family protein [Rickettsiales bacterium]